MFFKQIFRNATKSRKNNGLFFGSIIIAIIAFYTLLSLENQDVMVFLKTLESDAVNKLMLLIPVVYVVSLFFVFFLVYFAYKYQMDSRRKEFGLYLMLGMKRSKLFLMLMAETLWNSVISILIGIPISLMLTEGISLATAKLVGVGIVEHKFSFSATALIGTTVGFGLVQFVSMICICIQLNRKEPMELLKTDSPEKQKIISNKKGWMCFIFGIILLVIAYIMGILLLGSFNIKVVSLTLIIGVAGTFLLFCGMGVFIGSRIVKSSSSKSGLYTFTGRQIQENVLSQNKALAISSLLLLVALTCVSFGIGIGSVRGSENNRSVDFSIEGDEEEIVNFLKSNENKSLISSSYIMYLDSFDTDKYMFEWGLTDALETQPESNLRNNMIDNLKSDNKYQPIIQLESYNNLLKSLGKEPIKLEKNQVAFYTSKLETGEKLSLIKGALKNNAYITVDGERYDILSKVFSENVVADRKINLSSAIIVSNEDYEKWQSDSSPLCWNFVLNEDNIAENGLMQEIQAMQTRLNGTGIQYESYLGGIGRNLFYTVASSYLTIYLGILFMLIANTVIGLKFLMQQIETKHRYITLLMLGASIENLCVSAKKQIKLFFSLVVGMALFSSIFAIISMFTSFMKLPQGASAIRVFIISGVAFVLFIAFEIIYITVVERTSRREIQALSVADRR